MSPGLMGGLFIIMEGIGWAFRCRSHDGRMIFQRRPAEGSSCGAGGSGGAAQRPWGLPAAPRGEGSSCGAGGSGAGGRR